MKTELIRLVCLTAVLISSGSVAMAAKEVFQRSKPHVNVGMIGGFDEGTVVNLTIGALPLDGAILVVSALDGLTEETLEEVLHACLAGVPVRAVFIDQTDQVGDPKQLELLERDIRTLLNSCWYQGEATPIIRSSASGALARELEDAAVLADLFDAIVSEATISDGAADNTASR